MSKYRLCIGGPCDGEAVEIQNGRDGDTMLLRTAPRFVAGVDPDPSVRGMVWHRTDAHHYQHAGDTLRFVRSVRSWQNTLSGEVLSDEEFRAVGGYALP